MAAERAGVPAVVNTCEGFKTQGQRIGALGGLPWEPVVIYPGHIDTYDLETRARYISELVAPGNEEALTTQIEEGAAVPEPPETTISFKGTFDEVLNYYHLEKMWSDGLPIVPPTKEKVEEFLKYTDYPADAILTRPLPPSYREVTPWSVAVNGVLAGCRPEYMPALVGIAKCWAEPSWGMQDHGQTPGISSFTVINGPIADQLGMNYHHTYGRSGYQSNTSMGRFYSMYKRNLAEIRVEDFSDMGTHGLPDFSVMAENDELCHSYGWKTLAEERGFKYGDNVVHSMSINNVLSAAAIEETTAEGLMWKIVGQICEGQAASWRLMGNPIGSSFSWQVFIMTKVVADVFAKEGWDKEKICDYIYNNAKRTARYFETRYQRSGPAGAPGLGFFCDLIKSGGKFETRLASHEIRKEYCESEDPDRLVPMFAVRDRIMLILAGDEVRNRVACYQNNGEGSYFTSMKIELPKNWDALYAASELKKDLDNLQREFKCI